MNLIPKLIQQVDYENTDTGTLNKNEFLRYLDTRGESVTRTENNLLNQYNNKIPHTLLDNTNYLGQALKTDNYTQINENVTFNKIQDRQERVRKVQGNRFLPVKHATRLGKEYGFVTLRPSEINNNNEIDDAIDEENITKEIFFLPDIPLIPSYNTVTIGDTNQISLNNNFEPIEHPDIHLLQSIYPDLGHRFKFEILSNPGNENILKLIPKLRVNDIDFILIRDYHNTNHININIHYINNDQTHLTLPNLNSLLNIKDTRRFANVSRLFTPAAPYHVYDNNLINHLNKNSLDTKSFKNKLNSEKLKNYFEETNKKYFEETNKNYKLNDPSHYIQMMYHNMMGLDTEDEANTYESNNYDKLYKQTQKQIYTNAMWSKLRDNFDKRISGLFEWLKARNVDMTDLQTLYNLAIQQGDRVKSEQIKNIIMERLKELDPGLWYNYISQQVPHLTFTSSETPMLYEREFLNV